MSQQFVDAQSHMSTPARPQQQQMQHYQPRPQQLVTPVRSLYPSLALDTPGSSKSVRFQSQPLPQTQLQQQQQPYNAGPQQPQQQQQQVQSQYSSPSSQSQAPTPQRSVTASQASAPAKPASTVPAAAVTKANEVAITSNTSLTRRLKWNTSALALIWVTPLITTRPKDIYWAGLDLVYEHLGGNLDERVDAVVGWSLWATTVILLFNAIEALVLLNRKSVAAAPTNKTATVMGFQSPGAVKSLNFVAASRLKGSPKTRVSSMGPGSPISPSRPRSSTSKEEKETVDYSRFSPSLHRSSPSAASSMRSVSASGLGRTHASPMPTSVSMNNLGTNASPLSAFRARHTSSSFSPRPLSSSRDVSLSYESEDSADTSAFLGDESFEVERALHSLRSSMPPALPIFPQQSSATIRA